MYDTAANRMDLSRIFLWYGADYVRPHRMPAWLPASPKAVLRALDPWLAPDLQRSVSERAPSVGFQRYDWALACTVA